jgi:hypothetical protein
LRLIELGPVVVVNDFDDWVARVNPLKVLNVDGFDVPGNLGGQRRRIGLQVGVVGGLQRGRANPKIPFEGDNEDQTSDKNEDEQPDNETQRKSSGRPLWHGFYALRRFGGDLGYSTGSISSAPESPNDVSHHAFAWPAVLAAFALPQSDPGLMRSG